LLERAAHLPRRTKLWTAVAAAAVLGLLSCFIWGSPYRLPYRTVDSGVTGETLLGTDDRTITLAVDWGPCEYQPDLVARESADRVVLVLRRKDFSGPGVGCDGPGGAARMSAELGSPLGNRRVVDAVTGEPVQILHGRNLARPGYLPPGYHEDTGVNRSMYGLAPAQVSLPQYTRAFRTGPAGGPAPLLITQTLGGGGRTTGPGQLAVQGHPAAFTTARQGALGEVRTLSWFDGTYQYTVSTIAPNPLSDQELSRIADGLALAG
jgi:hypothetical protein